MSSQLEGLSEIVFDRTKNCHRQNLKLFSLCKGWAG